MKTAFIYAWVLMSVFTMSHATAADEAAGNRGSELRQMMHDHQQMTQDVLGMMKETMGIFRYLDQKPTGKEKQRLEEMMAKLEKIMKKEKEMAQHQDDIMGRRLCCCVLLPLLGRLGPLCSLAF